MAYNGYSGGMMIHTGYVFGGTSTPMSGNLPIRSINIEGLPVGIGGALRLNFGQYLRIGGEGYSTTLHYNGNGSYATTGWGGVLVDCAFVQSKHVFFLGTTIGGGSYRNLTLTHPIGDDWEVEEETSYRKYGFMAITPFVGYEYALTPKIHLIVKLDYLFNITNSQPDFSTGHGYI